MKSRIKKLRLSLVRILLSKRSRKVKTFTKVRAGVFVCLFVCLFVVVVVVVVVVLRGGGGANAIDTIWVSTSSAFYVPPKRN